MKCRNAFKYLLEKDYEEFMPDLTEEEYDALDEKWTKNTPKVGPNGTGFLLKRRQLVR